MIGKRTLAVLLLVLLATYTFAGGQEESKGEVVVWRLASKMPPESIEGRGFQVFVDKVAERSNGKMRVDLYPSEQLGATDAVMELLREGTVDVYVEAATFLDRYISEFSILTFPFLFQNREQWRDFVSSPMFAEWTGRLESEFGISFIGSPADFIRGPYNVLVSTKPVKSFGDVRGLKIRMPGVDTLVAVWKEFKADPMILPWTEVYESLQRGLVEAAGSPIGLVEQMGFQEVAKYILKTDELPQGIAFMVNKSSYDSLSPELKRVVRDAHQDACAYNSENLDASAEKSVESMKAQGVSFNQIDMSPFVAAARALYSRWEKEGNIPSGIIDYIDSLK